MSSESKKEFFQYTILDGIFVKTGRTVTSLEPGFYSPESTEVGIGLTPKDLYSDELIDLPGTLADDLIGDVEKFLSVQRDYEQYRLTHKRGYLLWGPPGSGKTSLGIILARRFIDRVGGVVIFASSAWEFLGGFHLLADVEPGRPVMYLIEEADAILDHPQCLGCLDGELSVSGTVFVAMTNYHEKLPPRIANRPGRFDRVEFISAPPAAVQTEYLRRIVSRNPEADQEVPARIVESLEGIPISLAHLREAFISHSLMGHDLGVVRARFEEMTSENDEDGDEENASPTHTLLRMAQFLNPPSRA